ncbi:hypothetical protein AX289_25340 [Methylorubrum populi]|nr:hypothetical protein AX289_25340 [Methylorubrum populi]
MAGCVLLKNAATWIGVVSDRNGLGLSLHLGGAVLIGECLSADRVGRLARADAAALAEAGRAAAEAAPALSRPAPRRPAGGAARRIDGDERRRDATQRQVAMARKTLEALAPRTVDAGLDAKCDLNIGIRARRADGQWHVWKFLGHTLSANLAEMAPTQAGRYLIPSRSSVCSSGRPASRT